MLPPSTRPLPLEVRLEVGSPETCHLTHIHVLHRLCGTIQLPCSVTSKYHIFFSNSLSISSPSPFSDNNTVHYLHRKDAQISVQTSSKQRVLLISSHHPDICFKSSTDEQGQMRRIRSCIKHANIKGPPLPTN